MGDSEQDRPTRSEIARQAMEILLKEEGFFKPTRKQKENLVVAFARRGKVVHGNVFDAVKLEPAPQRGVGGAFSGEGNLPDEWNKLDYVEGHLDEVTLYEMKSTKECEEDFEGHFFSLTGAPLLAAQSLTCALKPFRKREWFKFVFVSVADRKCRERTLPEVLAQVKHIYNNWHIQLDDTAHSAHPQGEPSPLTLADPA